MIIIIWSLLFKGNPNKHNFHISTAIKIDLIGDGDVGRYLGGQTGNKTKLDQLNNELVKLT